jgi:hypothetical protein
MMNRASLSYGFFLLGIAPAAQSLGDVSFGSCRFRDICGALAGLRGMEMAS